MKITRDFTTSTVIVHRDSVLLHMHKKLGIWLPVGGHIDKDELPQDSALREIKEESGLDVKLFGLKPTRSYNDAKALMVPAHIILEDIEEGHQHIDFIFYATSDTDRLAPQDGETSDLRWFTKEELESEDIPDNVRIHSLEALMLLGKPTS
jgi:ADP-ribose pyrophosphatase YjhB (NUDIX family)